MCLVTVEIWVTTPPIMLLPLALLGSSLAIMSSHVGFVTTLTLLSVLVAVTTSVRPFNVYNTFEKMLRRSTRTEFSFGTSHRVLCARCAPHVIHRFVAFVSAVRFLLSLNCFLSNQVMDRLSSSMSTVSSIDDFSGHNVWNPLFELLFLEHVNGLVDSFLKGHRLGQDRIFLSLCS